jgi:hypothetical protein
MRNLRSDTTSAIPKTPVIAPSLASSPTIPYFDNIPVVALKILGTTAAMAILTAEGKIPATSNDYIIVSATTQRR